MLLKAQEAGHGEELATAPMVSVMVALCNVRRFEIQVRRKFVGAFGIIWHLVDLVDLSGGVCSCGAPLEMSDATPFQKI
jgi:hypothetical protein